MRGSTSLTGMLVVVAGLVSSPALAQTEGDGWSGFYVGGSIGHTTQTNDEGSSILFDTNQDGTFGDTVRTAAGADAFAPGFCGGSANGNSAAGQCRNDNDGIEYFGHVGFDRQMNNLVIGVVGEFGKTKITDSVTGFSSTPASYTLTRTLKHSAGLRLRAGYTPNDVTLFYVTGGGAYGKVRNIFLTTNTANTFTGNGSSDNAWGWSLGGGIDQKITPHISFGLQYLFTQLNNDDYVVRVGRGAAPATNPFILASAAGTDIARSDGKFRYHSLRATAAFHF